MLREGTLRSKLLLLQILNPALKVCNLGFVHFDRRWRQDGRCSRLARGLRLLSAGEPHDDDHEQGDADDHPGLDVLRKQARWLWCFVLDRFVHGFPLSKNGSRRALIRVA